MTNTRWESLFLENIKKCPIWLFAIYKLDTLIKCYDDQVQQAMLEEEEKIMAPTLVPVMSHIK